ncbi:24102_t:CDS:1, partial [Racocetra persica]
MVNILVSCLTLQFSVEDRNRQGIQQMDSKIPGQISLDIVFRYSIPGRQANFEKAPIFEDTNLELFLDFLILKGTMQQIQYELHAFQEI